MRKDYDTGDMWEILVANEVATEDELELTTSIMGYSEETMEHVLYVRTGYRDFKQYEDRFKVEA